METRFKNGQKVRATATAQGLVTGQEYTVEAVAKAATLFGTFVCYTLVGAEGQRLEVGNGNFVLTEVEERYEVRVRVLGEGWQPAKAMTLVQLERLMLALKGEHGRGGFEVTRSQSPVQS
jgi:hypothetical protein